MNKDTKILLFSLLFSLILIISFATILGSKDKENETLQEIQELEVNPTSFDLGNVPINGGIVTREYQVKNSSSVSLKLKKIVTSCMCTKAAFEIGEKKTRFFGMEGHGDLNPPVNIEIPAGASGKVIVQFDPAAHGPQGIGSFERSIYLTFSDPAGIKELKFSGTVVN